MLGHQVLIDLLIMTNMVRSSYIFSSNLITISISQIKSKWIETLKTLLRLLVQNIFYLRGILSEGILPGGVLERGHFVWEDFVQWGYCSGEILS